MDRSLLAIGLAVGLLGSLSGCVSAPPVPQPTISLPTTGPVVVAVVGDSLSRGYNACGKEGEDCVGVSWAGGDDARVDSVSSRLGGATDTNAHVENDARSGSYVADIGQQVTSALAARPNLVTLAIGGNDVCSATLAQMTSTAAYAARITSVLSRIARTSPDTTVLVASVPDVTALITAAGRDATARSLWKAANSCPTALADPLSTAPDAVARRAAVRERITEYDTVLAGACIAAPRCVYDGGALTSFRFTLDQLSPIDRFHPSVAGLHEIAAIEWKALAASDRAAPLLNRAG